MRDLVDTAILLGILQGAVLVPVLWTRRANQLSNRILAALVGAVALMLLLQHLEGRWGWHGHPHLLGLTAPLPFLFGPLLYLYAITLTRPLVRFEARWLVLALPFAGDLLYMAQAFYFKAGDEKLAIARASNGGAAPLSWHVVNALEVVQALVYLFLTWRALERYSKKMKGYFSDLARIDLRWLKALVLAHLAVWSVVLFANVLRWTANAGISLGPLVQIGSSFFIFLTGYVSLWQPELAQKAKAANAAEEDAPRESAPPEPAATLAIAPGPPPLPKYQRNRLDEAEAQELVRTLHELMAERRLYRDSGLTLSTLADALACPPHTLSQVLNLRIGKSFFVFVNSYRTDALKEALADPSRAERGVLELALDVGFNSKSAFNSFFKKHTGTTPTEFRIRALAARRPEKSAG